ncbi:MAG: hypothetical protein ACREV4_03025 [Gammaproteobacteria bacterium]
MKTWIGVLLSLGLQVSALAVPNDGGSLTAYVGATLLDGTGRAPRPDTVVLVVGERIAAVGSRNEVTTPKEARAVDAKGKWILPGLIDAHVHFFQSGGLYTRPDVIDLRRIRPYTKEIAWIKQRLPRLGVAAQQVVPWRGVLPTSSVSMMPRLPTLIGETCWSWAQFMPEKGFLEF